MPVRLPRIHHRDLCVRADHMMTTVVRHQRDRSGHARETLHVTDRRRGWAGLVSQPLTVNVDECQPVAPSGMGGTRWSVWTYPDLSVARHSTVCRPGARSRS